MKDYKDIFKRIESTLIKHCSRNLPVDKVRGKFNEYEHFEGKPYSDAEYYRKLVHIIFYAGFKTSTVTERLPYIEGHFHDYEMVATYGKDKVNEILLDKNIIRNRRKIESCIKNAQKFKSIVDDYGSFQAYIDSLAPYTSFENLMLLKEELQYLFSGLGPITAYHFLTDIGKDVIKPDRVICRIFKRLELIEDEQQLLKTVIQGRKFAQATEHSSRYIDIIFVKYGQVKDEEFGLKKGICLEKNPDCLICGVQDYCKEPFGVKRERQNAF